MSEHIAPEADRDAFHCPLCGTYAKQRWFRLSISEGSTDYRNIVDREAAFQGSHCSRCEQMAVWFKKRMIYPITSGAPQPNADLPDAAKADYREADAIAQLSPRGAAALLRLAIQRICVHLGQAGKHLHADIGALVAKGLPHKVQEALDAVRVIGNDCVHPGQMSESDTHAVVKSLFQLVNFIAEKTISEPKAVDQIYSSLPSGSRDGIRLRDSSQTSRATPSPSPTPPSGS